jgi:hypothetical protein
MSVLDAIFQRAPGIVAQGLKGQREGREYQDKLRQQAMMDSLANRRADTADEGINVRRQLAELKAEVDRGRLDNDTKRTTNATDLVQPRIGLMGAQANNLDTRTTNDPNSPEALAARWAHEREMELLRQRGRAKDGGASSPDQLIYDSATGQYVWANPRTHAVTPAGSLAKAPPKDTEAEQKSYLFAQRGNAANKQLGTMDANDVNPNFLQRQLVKHDLTNPLGNAEAQSFQRSATDFVMAVLRKDSGAQINKDEWNMAYKTWLPRPGDSDQLKIEKAAARKVALDALGNTAGTHTANFAVDGRAPVAGGEDRAARAARLLAEVRGGKP